MTSRQSGRHRPGDAWGTALFLAGAPASCMGRSSRLGEEESLVLRWEDPALAGPLHEQEGAPLAEGPAGLRPAASQTSVPVMGLIIPNRPLLAGEVPIVLAKASIIYCHFCSQGPDGRVGRLRAQAQALPACPGRRVLVGWGLRLGRDILTPTGLPPFFLRPREGEPFLGADAASAAPQRWQG